MQLITLTTDFSTRDWFVGAMKGVMVSLAPRARVIDLTHEIPTGDIRAGAFALAAAYACFPKGTVHLAVVDPGVGSSRGALAVQTERAVFVGPDNGVLSLALRREHIRQVRSLDNQAGFLPSLSRTFHGRDLFAPFAARLCRGFAFGRVGPRLGDYVRLPWPEPQASPGGIEGEVIYVDRFGNAITNIDEARLASHDPASLRVFRKNRALCGIGAYYAAVPRGEAVGVFGSTGCLEVAVNQGNAARQLKLRVGEAVAVRVIAPGRKSLGKSGSPAA